MGGSPLSERQAFCKSFDLSNPHIGCLPSKPPPVPANLGGPAGPICSDSNGVLLRKCLKSRMAHSSSHLRPSWRSGILHSLALKRRKPQAFPKPQAKATLEHHISSWVVVFAPLASGDTPSSELVGFTSQRQGVQNRPEARSQAGAIRPLLPSSSGQTQTCPLRHQQKTAEGELVQGIEGLYLSCASQSKP